MTPLITIHCTDAGVRLSRMTEYGEEIVDHPDPGVLALAAKVWAAVAGGPLTGYADTDGRIVECQTMCRDGFRIAADDIADLQRRVATLEQAAVRAIVAAGILRSPRSQ